MEDFKVERYASSHYSEWNAFLLGAKNATFLFHRDFMEYHNDRFEDFSLMVYKKGKLFALLPANKVGNKVYSHQGLTYGSLVLLNKAKLTDAFYAFKKMLEFLFLNDIKKLDVRVIPSFYNTLPSDELAYFLFKADAKLINRDALMVINYKHKLDFQKNRREGINKAIRNGLSVKIDTNYEGFWNTILIPNLKNKHDALPVHTLNEIKLLASRFPENIKQVSVYKDGEIVAGTTVFLTKTTIHPQYVSANVNKNALGSLDLAYDFIINKLSTYKSFFDFNISSENKGAKLNLGLIFWKESCGARTYVADNYVVKTKAFKTLMIDAV
tara:strand:- start:31331 stop:32308 length:978 start_codon:yes stop_codon:yes gene_type:complete